MDLEERVEEYRFIIVTTKLYVETKRFINNKLPKINRKIKKQLFQ